MQLKVLFFEEPSRSSCPALLTGAWQGNSRGDGTNELAAILGQALASAAPMQGGTGVAGGTQPSESLAAALEQMAGKHRGHRHAHVDEVGQQTNKHSQR